MSRTPVTLVMRGSNRDILKPTYEYGFKKEDFYNLPFRKIITDKNLNNCYCKIEQI